MATVTSIAVEVGATKNMGNYESARLSYRVEVRVEPGEDPVTTRAMIRKKLEAAVAGDIGELFKKKE